MRTIAVLAVALAAAVACSGTSGVREHSEAVAVAAHCDQHACAGKPAAVDLGEGCYAVDRNLYQCAADGPGDPSCFEVPLCTEVCDNKVTDGRGIEISTKRCEALWRDYQQAHRPPPTCRPVEVAAFGSAATLYLRTSLALPAAVVEEVVRSGKDRLVYEARVCATADRVVVDEPTRVTGFARVDSALHAELAKVALARGACADIPLVASRFDCD